MAKTKIQKLEAAIKVVEDARDILENPKFWCKGSYAKTRSNYPVGHTDGRAVKFCSIGAIQRAVGDTGLQAYSDAFHILKDGGDIVEFNDNSRTRHKHIVMAFDFTILAAKDDLKAMKKAAAKKKGK